MFNVKLELGFDINIKLELGLVNLKLDFSRAAWVEIGPWCLREIGPD